MSLVGKYLIARPTIQYGYFKNSVIYIYEDAVTGTAGVALNNPTQFKLSDLSRQMGLRTPVLDLPIYSGGPVRSNSVMLIHSDDFVSTNTLFTGASLNISSDDTMIEKLTDHNWPEHFKLVTGAATWLRGQLDEEIDKNLWLVAELPVSMTMTLEGVDLWDKAIDTVGKKWVAEYFLA